MKYSYLKLAVLTGLFFANLSSGHAASLSYFEQSTEGLVWKWFSPETKTISTAHTFKTKPSSLYWEHDHKHILALNDNKLLTFDRRGEAVGSVALPHLMTDEKTIGLWRDRTTKRLRFATRYMVPQANVGGTVENPTLKDITGKQINGLAKPEWGSHAILKIYELTQSETQWNIIVTLPTKTEAGDTPGVSVLKYFWNEDGDSDIKLTSSKFCAKYGGLYRGRQCHIGNDSHARASFFSKVFPECKRSPEGFVLGRECPIDAVGQMSCEGCTYDLLHASVEGDRLHAALPLYLKNKKTGELTQVPGILSPKVEQVLIDLRGNYSVIETIHTPGHIYVLDLMTGEIILDTRGENSMWFSNE